MQGAQVKKGKKQSKVKSKKGENAKKEKVRKGKVKKSKKEKVKKSKKKRQKGFPKLSCNNAKGGAFGVWQVEVQLQCTNFNRVPWIGIPFNEFY